MVTTKSKLLVSSIVSIVVLTILAFSISNNGKNNSISKFRLDDKYYNNGEKLEVDDNGIKDFSNDSYLLFIYSNICTKAKPCEEVFDEVLKRNKIDYVSISHNNFKKTSYYEKIKNAPSFAIIKNGIIIEYIDSENDADLNYFLDENEFKKWLSNYIDLK